MMRDTILRLPLKLHPDFRCDAVTSIEVEIERTGGRCLSLAYVATGDVGSVTIRPFTEPARTNGLWRHTCFEAFIRVEAGPYYEFNLSPAGNWAAYRLGGYRSDLTDAAGISRPAIAFASPAASASHSFEVRTTLDLSGLVDLPEDRAWRIGLSAIIEEQDCNLSYWALAHPHGQADFHHADCFALELDAARRA